MIFYSPKWMVVIWTIFTFNKPAHVSLLQKQRNHRSFKRKVSGHCYLSKIWSQFCYETLWLYTLRLHPMAPRDTRPTTIKNLKDGNRQGVLRTYLPNLAIWWWKIEWKGYGSVSIAVAIIRLLLFSFIKGITFS